MQSKPRILIGTGTCGVAAGADAVLTTLERELDEDGLEADIIQVGCIGLCYAEPLVDIVKPGRPSVFYGNLTPELAAELVRDYMVNDNPRPDLALGTLGEGDRRGHPPPLRPSRCSSPRCASPCATAALSTPPISSSTSPPAATRDWPKALKMSPEQVIDEVKKSGLRGRGGAGFPTGQKWEFCRDAPGSQKYIICNADEGDPGAFMNRSLLEGDPHAVLEGMLIGAYAIGASEGYIYCRAEYPLAIERLKTALDQMQQHGLLGREHPRLRLQLRHGDQGRRRRLRLRRRDRADGLHRGQAGHAPAPAALPGSSPASGASRPTSTTWRPGRNVSAIMQKGADWYAGFGTEKSKGTKTFSLAGKVNRTGLIEVPLGITLGEIIYGIGGGILGRQAVQGRADRRPFRRLPAGQPPRLARRLRVADRGRLHHGVGRHGRHGRGHLHGGPRPLLPDLHPERVLRQVRPLPRGHQADARHPGGHHPAARASPEDIEHAAESWARPSRPARSVRPGPDGSQPGADHPPLLPRRVRGPHQREALPGAGLQGADQLLHPAGQVPGLRDLPCANCPAEAIKGGKQMVHVIDQEKCIKCGTCFEVCPSRFSAVVKVSGQKWKSRPSRSRRAKPGAGMRSRNEEAAMDKITLTIDGKEVEAKQRDATVLEAAQDGRDLHSDPVLPPDLEPYGGCRLCIVEIEKMRGLPPPAPPRPPTAWSCKTDTPQLEQSRRGALELIMADHHAMPASPAAPELPALRRLPAERGRHRALS